MISLRGRLIRFFARRYFARIKPEGDLGELRQAFESIAGRLRTPRSVDLRHASTGKIASDWLVPKGKSDGPVLLYLHGGVYVMGSSRTHRRLVASIAIAGGMRAILPNYRLAPEYPYPAAIEDACAVYRDLLSQGIDPASIVIAGDSAGGGLAVATLLALRDAGDPMPAAAALLSPWLDLTGSGESMQTRAGIDPLFRAKDMPAAAAYYCGDEDRSQPLISPVFADVTGLPPTFIQVGDQEILLSDSTRMTDKLSAAGIPVTLQVWPEMWHVFQFFVGQMPEATRAVRQMGRYLRAATADGQGD